MNPPTAVTSYGTWIAISLTISLGGVLLYCLRKGLIPHLFLAVAFAAGLAAALMGFQQCLNVTTLQWPAVTLVAVGVGTLFVCSVAATWLSTVQRNE